MKKTNSLWGKLTLTVAVLFSTLNISAQINSEKYETRSFESLVNIKQQRTTSNKTFHVPLAKGVNHEATINVSTNNNGSKEYIGSIANKVGGTFRLNVINGNVSGYSILQNEKKAFEYSTVNGVTYVEEVNINKIMCVDFDEHHTKHKRERSTYTPGTSAAATDLESFPGALGCVLIDFDGEYVVGTYWNSGNPIDALPSNHTDAQKTEIWEIASADLRPFSINVTTNEAVYLTYPQNRRMRVIVTPTTTAYPGSGGVAYIGSFNWNNETPCWVFNQGTKACGETVSHEVGHTFDVLHDGYPGGNYYYGQGDWAPIMGAGFYEPIVQWSKGEYSGANQTQDDLALISGTKFGVGYRADDHSNTTASATSMIIDQGGNVSEILNFGIVEKTSDVDFFSFTTSGGSIALNVNTVNRHGNLDVLAKLYDGSGNLISSFNDAGLHAVITTTVAAGTYYLSVEGTGAGDVLSQGYTDYGSLGSFFISGSIPTDAGGNIPPNVAITNPTNGSTFSDPANFNITASASDVDGNVAQVEFFSGATSLGVVSGSGPYSVNYTPGVGTYNLTAIATDNEGATTTSSIVTITVEGANNGPSVVITNPANGSTFSDPANINITANASDTDGSIAQVEFFSGATSLGVVSGSGPFSVNYNPAVGTHNLTAVATDNDGATTISSIVTITVESVNVAPTVVITNPTNGSAFSDPANINITANASDSDGNIAQVEFFSGATSLGVVSGSGPYSVNYTPGVGAYTLTAVATDNEGATTTSSIVNITVESSGSCTDPAWSSTAVYSGGIRVSYAGSIYSANYWTQGQRPDLFSAPYGHWTNVGPCSTENIAPTVSITSPSNSATYTDPANFNITANASDVDGTIAQVEFFSGATSLGIVSGTGPFSVSYSPSIGTYNLTAVATDNDGATTTSSVVTITVEAYVNTPPSVAITSPSNGTVFTDPASFNITATASDNGSIAQVEFFSGSTSLGVISGSGPYSVNYTPAIGVYNLTAVATDNEGLTSTSAIVSITVEAYVNLNPTIVITSPTNGTNFDEGSNTTITVDVTDADGTVDLVEFFINQTRVGQDLTAPFSFDWLNLPVGTYTLFAIATDNDNGVTTSTNVTVTVTEPSTCTLPEWQSTAVYGGGNQVSYNGINYQSKWWTSGQRPDLNSSQWAVWTNLGACGPIFESSDSQSGDKLVENSVSWNLYPNPSNGTVTIAAKLNEISNVVITVKDIAGSTIETINLFNKIQVNEQLNLRHLTTGVYFVNTNVNGVNSTQKLIIK
jgi:chitodextrinase